MFEYLRKNAKALYPSVMDGARRFERGILVFPVAVTVLAALAFLLGGCAAAWQWWLPVVGIGGWMMWGCGRSRLGGLLACSFFLVLLMGIWVAAGMLMPVAGIDNIAYHLPATRLLIEGWNPVFAPTPETLATTMGVNPWEMRQWHVLFMSKAVWMFNAVAYTFTRAPFGLLVPLFPFLFLAAAGQVWRLLRGNPWGVRLMGIVFLWIWAPGCSGIVDAAVCLGGVGLLATMARRLIGERGTELPLLCMSFWMMTAKQTGLLACFVFWVCFSVVLLVRERGVVVRFLAKMGGVVTLLFLMVCASPYLTSWAHYGHPLYPAYSVDEDKHPTYDITADFRICNKDARTMGHLGSFINAYLSPTLARAYYNWKLHREDYAPNRYVWRQGHENYNSKSNPNTPLQTKTRLLLLMAFVTVAMLGGRRLRFVWITAGVGLLCVPTAYLGYLRYAPWLAGIKALAVCSVFVWANTRLPRSARPLLWGAVGVMALPFMVKQLLLAAIMFDQTSAVHACLRESPPKALYACLYSGEIAERYARKEHCTDTAIFGHPSHVPLVNLRLLCRQAPELIHAKVRPLAVQEEADYPPFPNGEFRMEKGFSLVPFSEHARVVSNPDRKVRLLSYPGFILRTFLCTAPRLLWKRLGGG